MENYEKIEGALRMYYRASRIPVSLLRGNERVVSNYPFIPETDIAWAYMERFLMAPEGIRYLMRNSIMTALIRIPGTDYQILVGPVPEEMLSAADRRRIQEDLGLGFSAARDIYRWTERVPVMGRARFLSNLRLLSGAVAGVPEAQDEILVDIVDKEMIHEEYVLSDAEMEEGRLSDAERAEPYYHSAKEIEERILGCVEQGKTEELKKVLTGIHQNEATIGEIAPTFFRNLQYAFISAAAIVSRAAIRGGMDYEEARLLSDGYLKKLEKITTTAELLPTLGIMMVDFCEQVERLAGSADESGLTRAVRRDVLAHLREPLSIRIIAARIGRSPSHLSHLFKADTGMTIAAYIRQERVRTAMSMLSENRLSLVEIADTLCFSSLPHFEKIFKEVTGVTPGVYRRNLM